MKTPPDIATKLGKLFSENIPSFRLTMTKRRQLAAALGLLFAAGPPALPAADPPHLIPFQGHLARPSANDPTQFEPVPAGRYDILFTLYAAPVGGESKVWGPERHAQVTVVNGLVNALLGSVIGFQDAVAANANFFARPLYVGITIDADGNPNTADLELVPRQVLLPSVFALNANKLDGFDWHDLFSNGNPTTGKMTGEHIADRSITEAQIAFQAITSSQIASATITSNNIAPETLNAQQIAAKTITGEQIADSTLTAAHFQPCLQSDSIVPPGSIVAFAGTSPPPGWLLCAGQTVKKAQYQRLFGAIGVTWGQGEPGLDDDFSLPDLRGRTLTGAGHGLGLMARNLGDSGGAEQHTLTSDQMPPHAHTLNFGDNGWPDNPWRREPNQFITDPASPYGFNIDTFTTSSAGLGQAHPNMPPFQVVNYIIKL
jgi:microcystin-dependent protein